MPTKVKSRERDKPKIVTSSLSSKIDYPIFCFKHLKCKPKKDYKFFANFILRLNKLSNTPWSTIEKTDKHGLGTELIPVDQIKPKLPPFVTPEVTKLLVFRANGDNRPFLGLRDGNVFHVLFIEEKFGDVYDH